MLLFLKCLVASTKFNTHQYSLLLVGHRSITPFFKASFSPKFFLERLHIQLSLECLLSSPFSLCFQILYWECSITKSVFWMNYELSHKSSNAKLFLMTWMRHDRNCKSSGSYNVLFSAQNNTQKTMVGGQINILDMRKRKGICYHSHMALHSFVNIDFFSLFVVCHFFFNFLFTSSQL